MDEYSGEYGRDRQRAIYTVLPGGAFRASLQFIDVLSYYVKPSYGRLTVAAESGEVQVAPDAAADLSEQGHSAQGLSPCEADCLDFIRKRGRRTNQVEIIDHFCRQTCRHGKSTVREALPKLVKQGRLTSPGKGRRARGYGLPEWSASTEESRKPPESSNAL